MITTGVHYGADFKNWMWLLDRQKQFWCLNIGWFFIQYNYRRRIGEIQL